MGGKRWTTREENYLIEHAETKLFDEIAEDLGRTTTAVAGKWRYMKKCGRDLPDLQGRKKEEEQWSNEERQKLIDEWEDKEVDEFVEEMDRTESAIYTEIYRLRKKGKIGKHWSHWSEEDENKLINMWEWGFERDLRKAFPERSNYALRKKIWGLRREGREIPVRKRSGIRYRYDQDYFNELNPENCYVAGFIAGDGCYIEDGRVLSLTQHADDEIYFRRLKKLMSFEGNLEPGDGDCLRFRIYGAGDLYKDLNEKFNITPKKSLTLQPPNITNKYHIIPFIAGLIDSDGCISKDRNTYRTNISGTEDVLEWVKSYIDEWCPGRGTPAKVRPHKNIFQYSFGGSRLSKLKGYLIPLNLPLMPRKWDKVEAVY